MHCKNYDITFIMKYIIYTDGTTSEEVTGFYYGEPDLKATETFNGNTLAVFDNPYD